MTYKSKPVNNIILTSLNNTAPLIVAAIILAQSIINAQIQYTIGTVNVSIVDILALTGFIFLPKKLIFFPAIILMYSILNLTSYTVPQAFIRDLTPILYTGFLYFGLKLSNKNIIDLGKLSLYFLAIISIFYLIDSKEKWYRSTILTDAELIICFLVTFRSTINNHNRNFNLNINQIVTNLLLIVVMLAQITNGARSITVVILSIVIYQEFKNNKFFITLIKYLTIALLLTALMNIVRPLSLLRLVDIINQSDSYMGSVTLSYRFENYIYLINRILEQPIFGHGFGTYVDFIFGQKIEQVHPAWIVHNDYLALAYYYGILGSIILLIFTYLKFNKMFKPRHIFRNEIYVFIFSVLLLATNTPVLGNDTTGPLLWLLIGALIQKRLKYTSIDKQIILKK